MQTIAPKNKSSLSLFTMFSFVSLLLCCNDSLNFQPLSAHYSYDKMSIGLCKRVMNLYSCTWSVSEMFYQWWRSQTASHSLCAAFCLNWSPNLSHHLRTACHLFDKHMIAAWFTHSIIHQQVCPHTDMTFLTCFRALWSSTWVSLLSTKPEKIQRELIVTGRGKPNYLCCKSASIYPVCTDVKEVRRLFLGNKFKECAKSWRTGIHRKIIQTCSPQMA